MKVTSTDLPGVLVIEPRLFSDNRGFFYESYHAFNYQRVGIHHRFMQSNVSRSSHGVLRGLHYQWPEPQGKLVNVLEGEIYDVAVDIRPDSPCFGQSTPIMLTADNHRHLWIPEGFAHGFCVVSPQATVIYQCTAPYNPQTDAGIRWNDADLAIDWPVSQPLLSAKDSRLPLLTDIPRERLPVYAV